MVYLLHQNISMEAFMITYLIPPYEDELIYSFFSRNYYCYGLPYTTFNREFFNCSRLAHFVLYSDPLEYFLNQIAPELGLSEISLITNNSLAPYFVAFSVRGSLIEYNRLLRKRGTYNSMPLSTVDNDVIKICPVCCSEDNDKYGEIYIHRSHQVPGVEICTKHGNFLVKIKYNVKEYLDISKIEYDNYLIEYPDPKQHRILGELARDAEFILQGGMANHSIRMVKAKYYQKLKESGYRSGAFVNNIQLIIDFHDYYKNILSRFRLSTEDVNQRSWLNSFLKGYKNAQNPVKNLLLIHFLFGSSKEFAHYKLFQFNPFGYGPWACENKICPHAKERIITDIKIKYVNTYKKYTGTFKCPFCGYIYLLREDKVKPHILDYGPFWKDKLKVLILSEHESVLMISKEMQCDRMSVVRHAKKIGLTKELYDGQHDINSKVLTLRSRVLECIQENYNISEEKIKRELRPDYLFLKMHDFDWITAEIEKITEKRMYNAANRDYVISSLILSKILEVIDQNLPYQINKENLGAMEKCSAIKYHERLEELPKTKMILDQYCESIDQYHERIGTDIG